MKINPAKTPHHVPSLLVALALSLGAPPAESSSFLWNVASPGANNWNVNANWLPATGNPGAADTAIFGATGTSPDAVTINNVVSVNTTVAALTYTNTTAANWHVTQIPSGITLTVSGATTLGGVYNVNSLANLVSMVDAGTLALNGNLTAGVNGNSSVDTSTVDFSGLSNFVYSTISGNITLGAGARSTVNFHFAAVSNSVTALAFNDNTTSSSSSGTGNVSLGSGTNVFNVGAFNIAAARGSSTVSFPSDTGGLRIRGTNGTDSGLAAMTLGNRNNSGGSGNTSAGTLSLNGHPVDARLNTLTLGVSGSNPTGNAPGNGTISFDTGTIYASNILMAITTAGTTAGVQANGTINVGSGTSGATLVIGSGGLSMANQGASSGAATGNLNINGGAVVSSNSIVKSTSISAANITMTGGSLTMVAGTVGTPAALIDNVNLTSATLQFPVANNSTNLCANTLNLADSGNVVNITALPILSGYPSQFPIISYQQFPGGGSLSLGTLPSTYTGYVSNDTVNLLVWVVVTNGPATAKADQWGGGVNNLWDTTTFNWTNSSTAVKYAENDSVSFDDLARTNIVRFDAAHGPLAIFMTNNVLNYTFTGAGSITGAVTLVKWGPASLTLTETGGDNFGGIFANGGKLTLDNANSTISGNFNVATGATLQIGNTNGNGNLPAGNLGVDGTLILSRTNNLLVNNLISGAGSLIQNGNGTLTLANTNTYTGSTAVLKGALALAGAGSMSNSLSVLVSNATFDVSASAGPVLLNNLSLSNSALVVAMTNVQTPITIASGALAMGGAGNTINLTALPAMASYPVTLTLIQAPGGISGFNMSLGSLPVASPAYAGSIGTSGGTAVVLTLTSGPIGVRPNTTWSGGDVANLNTNWSDRLNWQLPGAPGVADNLMFSDTATVAASALSSLGGGVSAFVPDNINNIVDANFTISSLLYTNVANDYHNTLIKDGMALTITSAATNGNILSVGSSAVDFGGSAKGFVAIAGPKGVLNVSNSSMAVFVGYESASPSSQQATLDLSALGTFNATVSAFEVGALATTANSPSGIVYLAQTNTITATGGSSNETGQSETLSLLVGENGKNATTQCYLYLGQKTALNVNSVGIGIAKQSGTLQFNTAFSAPSVVIRGGDGVSPVSFWAEGDGLAQTGASSAPVGTADFTGGTVDALVTTMYLGRSPNNSNNHPGTGTLTFEAGVFNVATLIAGYQATAVTDYGVGNVNVNGTGTLIVNNLMLGVTVSSSANTAGTLILGGGSVQANSIIPGTNGANSTVTLNSGTLIINNSMGSTAAPLTTLNLNSGTLQLNLNGTASTNIVATTVSAGGTVTINIASIANITGGTAIIPLISYTGGDPYSQLTLGTVPSGWTGATLVDDQANSLIELSITPPPSLTWVGAVGSALNNNWDLSTTDWRNGLTPGAYANPDLVQFDDTASNGIVTLAATVSPANINIANNALNYTFNGPGKISGSTSLTKSGAGTVTLAETGGDNLTGGITVNNGTLILDNAGSSIGGNLNIAGGLVQLGNNDTAGNLPSGNITDNGTLVFKRSDNITVAGTITGAGAITQIGTNIITLSGANSAFTGKTSATNGVLKVAVNAALGGAGSTAVITNSGTLDLNGIAFNAVASAALFAAGSGYTNGGAIISSGTDQINALSNLTATANVTFGGTGRWDIRASSGSAASLNTWPAGSPYKITKIGPNETALVSVGTIDAALGDIDVQQGEFALQNATAQLGNPASNLIVHAGATLEMYGLSTPLNKVISLTGNGTNDTFRVDNGGATLNIVVGPVAISGNCLFDINGAGFVATIDSPIAGPGALIKTGLGTLTLTNVNTFSGITAISNGVLMLSGSGSLASPSISIAAGAALNASGRTDQTLQLNAGQTLSGFGTVTGLVSTASGSTVAPGSASTVGTLTVTGNTALGGATVMKLDKLAATNDVLSVGGTLALGGVLNVASQSGTLTTNDSFKLFSATGITGAFTSIVPAPGAGLGWKTNTLTTDGVLRIVATVNPNPTNITAMVVGSLLTLTWPADHTGWTLQAQTNAMAAGLNPNPSGWVNVPISTTINSLSFTMDPSKGTVFYRLVYNP